MQEQKGKKRAGEDDDNDIEEKRPRQQFDKDFTLEPFEGVSPEYMEMGESLLLTVFSCSVSALSAVITQCQFFYFNRACVS